MSTPFQILKDNKTIEKFLKKQGVILSYLFGSMARGEAHKESDVDIAILFNEKINDKKYLKKEGELIIFFSSFFSKREINIVNLNISSPLLRQSVILEGKIIYLKNELIRIFFEMQALKEYEDYLHLSEIYNTVSREKIRAL
jgi:predicted nucleotidyltransferase